ncbi:MAG: tyrosine-type recombinase/integrase [Acutalibacteraceae bacterium]
MLCKKCHKEIADNSVFCNWCGKKQQAEKRKKHNRAKGTGTIRYRADYAHNHYAAYSPADKFGKNSIYIGSYPTYKDAQTALEKYQADKITDFYNSTLSEIYDKWKENHFKTLTASGKQGYKSAYNYLKDLHNQKMRTLKTNDFQKCINKCAESRSRAQCEKVKQLSSQLCKFAMQNDVIDKNYASFLILPKSVKKEKEVFTDKELEILWQHKTDERVKIILILCYSGFRIGELFSIKKSNVDLNEHYIIAGNKTAAGINRFVPINDKIYDFIVEFYNKSKADYLINDDPSNFRKRKFYPVLSELNIIDPPIKNEKTGKFEYKNCRLTPHCTRHTFATLCQRAGMPPEALQKIIGHAKYETTADIYIHENTEELQSAIKLI